ncbi:MAG: alginate export family protein [Melioribacteraceae bacterium]|nr:alginate export family protein [Melioribacteraceae bacterium]MCO6472579.1 hypothetical protein [Melioribacteraceae bacterium]
MKKVITYLMVMVLMATLSLFAQENERKVDFKLNGVYTAWGQFQNDFRLGAVPYEDHYIVQMLRLNLAVNYGSDVKAVTRMDLGQGWWGVDNEPPTYRGASGLFDNKDTHYFLHVDHAYLWFNFHPINTAFSVGRFNWSVGNKLIIDNNYDGISADVKISDDNLKLGWAKISEGLQNTSDYDAGKALPYGNNDPLDANLFLASFKTKLSTTNLEIYGMYYNDAGYNDSTAFNIDGLNYNRPRFTPQVTSLGVFGVAGTSKIDKLTLAYEANYLMGKDKIDNKTHKGFLNTSNGSGVDPLKYDINNGDLTGYNIYLKMNYAVSDAVTFGLAGGMGSGDDDPTSGKGNINKLRTAGFFYLTEVWEDSIMPDEEGITPQGLGAPNVRAYRELENTTAIQANVLFKITPEWDFFTSFTYLKATQPIYAWTAAGPDLTKSADDIGMEIDFKTNYKIYDKLTLSFMGGYFMPGTGAQYLINGNDEHDDPAFELKTTITFAF